MKPNALIDSHRIATALLAVVVTLPYLILVWRGGHYGDGVAELYAMQTGGWQGFVEYLGSDRPLSAWVYFLPFKLFGHNAALWQAAALAAKILCAVCIGWLARRMFPLLPADLGLFAGCVALLFPAFAQQPVAALYFEHQLLILLILASFVLTTYAYRRSSVSLMLAAIVLAFIAYGTLEYYVGLEMVRILILFRLVGTGPQPLRRRVMQTGGAWWPYAVLPSVFVAWRMFIFKPTRAVVDQEAIASNFLGNPVQELFARAVAAVSDLLELTVISWCQTVDRSMFAFDSRSNYLVVVALVVLPALIFLLLRARRQSGVAAPEAESNAGGGARLMAFGGLAMIVALLPIWAVKREIRLSNLLQNHIETWDRYALPPMLGAVCFITGFVWWLTERRAARHALCAALLTLAFCFQLRNNWQYVRFWADARTFLAQVKVRIPHLSEDTTIFLFGRSIVYPKHSYTLGLPLNYLYNDKPDSGVRYWLFNLGSPLQSGDKQFLRSGNFATSCRTLDFQGDPAKALFLYYNTGDSLRVLSDETADEILELPALAEHYLERSNLGCISDSPLGREMGIARYYADSVRTGSWTYYFLRADLARQFGRWDEVLQFGREARVKKLLPGDFSEALIFIKAELLYGDTGRFREWVDLVREKGEAEAIDTVRQSIRKVAGSGILEAARTAEANRCVASLLTPPPP